MRSPEEGETYFTNNVLLTVSADNRTGNTTCMYRTSGSWNNITCEFNRTRTWEYGDITLTVMALLDGCNATRVVEFVVEDLQPDLVGDIEWFLFLPVGVAVFLVVIDDDEGCRRKAEGEVTS